MAGLAGSVCLFGGWLGVDAPGWPLPFENNVESKMLNKPLVREALARSLARRYAAALLLDMEQHAEAFLDDELTAAEQAEAGKELRRIAISICPEIDA